jgi:hypothetical protein
MIRTLTNTEAAPYFAHPSQQRASGVIGEPEEWMHYRALNDVCGAFHLNLWPGVWMGHIAVKPTGWGRSDQDVTAILQGFATETGAARIIGWVRESNRAMLALCRRVGFEIDGRLPLAEPVVMIGWSAKCQ